MFRTVIISIFFFLFAFAAAQDAEQDFIKAADEAYAQNDIDTALDLYKKAMAKDSSYESLWKYAACEHEGIEKEYVKNTAVFRRCKCGKR